MKSISQRWVRRIVSTGAACILPVFAIGSGLAFQASLPAAPSCMACPGEYEKGVAAYDSGNYAAAIQHLLAAQRDPHTPSGVLLYESRAFLQLQQPQKAEAAVQSYLAGNPPSADAYFLLGYIYFREKRPRRSLAEYTAGARLRRPDADALAAVALDYVLLHDYVDADRWLTQATRMAPTNSQYWYYLGRAKYNENRFQEAVNAFLECLKLDGRNVKGWNNLGLAHQGLGENREAIRDFQTAIRWQTAQGRPSAQPYLDLGDLLLSQGQQAKALAALTEAAKLAPQNPKAHEELGRAYEQSAMLKQAQVELQKAVVLAPQVSSLHFELGRIYKKEGLSRSAQKEFAKCAAINRSSSTDTLETPNPDGPG